jgi:hypothetical protein
LLVLALLVMVVLGSDVLESFVSCFVSFELIELDEQIVDVLDMFDFIDSFEAVKQGQSRNIENVDVDCDGAV